MVHDASGLLSRDKQLASLVLVQASKRAKEVVKLTALSLNAL